MHTFMKYDERKVAVNSVKLSSYKDEKKAPYIIIKKLLKTVSGEFRRYCRQQNIFWVKIAIFTGSFNFG